MRRSLAVAALFSSLFALCALCALSVPGCSGDSEGEPCDQNDDNGGNDDCAGNLVCTQLSKLSGVYGHYGPTNSTTAGICCPSNLDNATTPECTKTTSVPGGNPTVPDGGSSSSSGGSSSGAAEGGTDAPVDSPLTVDAPPDSPPDSPAGG